ncbi:MAG: substrate-binding domain-containing protein [Anaerolineaceae bacterium]|nr:substrate-binding domain-containing protein [Anaerolineaceae bacterium]
MRINERFEKIIALVIEHQFMRVSELSNLCDVSEMTIRRDLEKLDAQGSLKRTYGGAVSISSNEEVGNPANLPLSQSEDMLLLEKMDVIIASSVDPYFDSLMVNRAMKKDIPIIAESIEIPNQRTIVAVDNYQAGFDLGVWAQKYLIKNGVQKVNLLDMTFHQPNTLDRSSGFADGINSSDLACENVLSINAESRYASAYQIAQDALNVHPQINLIFAINDITALGAMDACRDLGIDPSKMTVLTFGLEGTTLINELMKTNSFCKAGLAMFPEIIGRVCIREAITAYNHQPQQKYNITPHAVLSSENLREYYTKTEVGWKLNWDTAQRNLHLPANIMRDNIQSENCPRKIGLIVPFPEHEWYVNLTNLLKEYAERNGLHLQVIDADQCVRDEVNLRRHQIARKAATLVNSGDVLLIDSGPVSGYLAEELKTIKDITVITNSVEAFDVLNRTAGIILISTGGALRSSTQSLVGPTAELALKELRADKLFLMVSGITQDFGLSHHTISEVTIKQAMIKSTREVIVVADHSAFKADVGIQVAPLDVVDQLITDDALPPIIRLELSKTGIHVEIA